MRCCPMCYCKAYLKNTGAMTCGTTMKIPVLIVDSAQLKQVRF